MMSTMFGELYVKSAKLVAEPEDPVTERGPVPAPAGTVAVISLFESMVKAVGTSLNRTFVTLAKPVPAILTTRPAAPPDGSNREMAGTSGLSEKVNPAKSKQTPANATLGRRTLRRPTRAGAWS